MQNENVTLIDNSLLSQVAKNLIRHHADLREPNEHYGRIHRYLKGDHDFPYMPRKSKKEFKALAERSITNWLPLISDTFAKGLFVDGYRPAKATENSAAWQYWQANGMDARQSITHRGALEFGVSYVMVLPGDPVPVITPLDPMRTTALYADFDDEWPEYVLIESGKSALGYTMYKLIDSQNIYTFSFTPASKRGTLEEEIYWFPTKAHDIGHTPVVRFRSQLSYESTGVIQPLMKIQDRVNESVFALMTALQYASFRQRWAAGLSVSTMADGAPAEPFDAAIDRLWVSDSADARFGDFAQTEVSGHLETYASTVRSMAAIAQISPHVLLGDLVNLSADALAAAEASTQRKIGEYETVFGESWEQVFRLASLLAKDSAGAKDQSAQVRWRDTEARSLAQTVDALGKMVQMLGVPVEAAWERIPGITDQDVQNWKALRSQGDVFTALLGDLQRQNTPQISNG